MTKVFIAKERLPVFGWTEKVMPIEEGALQQLKNMANMPFIHQHVAVMPDVHWGMGATVGSVIATKGAIIPAAVGVDIGCGMMAVKTNLKAKHLPDSLLALRLAIEETIPHGRTDNGGRNDKGAAQTSDQYKDRAHYMNNVMNLGLNLALLVDKHPELTRASESAVRQLGTLGTGNHFIELCLDEKEFVWVMLHSGSRGIGNKIGTTFIEKAKKDMERWFINLPDKDLAYIPEGSTLFNDYIEAVQWAQLFAKENRNFMMEKVLGILKVFFPKHKLKTDEVAINCHHNYVNKEHHYGTNVWLTRKGAVRAREGDLGIIPGSMGAKSFIVRGKGNKESFNSCSHGAGRKMSRTEANKVISLEDHIKATEGVECRKDKEVIDESPAAYKDIDAVMESQTDLVDIVHTLKQIVCVKG